MEKRADGNESGDLEGYTALMFAAGGGQKEIGTILLAAGADPTVKDRDAQTAEEFARSVGHEDVAKLLETKR